ncbi:glycine cleavage system H protein [Nadsonia fulvescens var. elongata DSM 6958]|uniref:Glycine cleavage system H protein n=1 Tax=Nadsonia fulvescens var. elongata DSM 6958 TaxID=857566 RepID=A0A1E3PGP8_9ASCO|nr:glycine cleavage system H protein [Nadsonia fulvescens var. elongata DSM 6958]
MFSVATRRFAFSAFKSAPVFRAATPRLFAPSLRFYSNALTKDSIVTKYSAGPIKVAYTEDHEWVALHEDGTAFVGITKYAADALGDATFVELATVGDAVEIGDSIGSIESVKSASEIYAPVTGEVSEANQLLDSNPGLVNQDPMGEGWIAQLQVGPNYDLSNLLDAAKYEEFLKSDH